MRVVVCTCCEVVYLCMQTQFLECKQHAGNANTIRRSPLLQEDLIDSKYSFIVGRTMAAIRTYLFVIWAVALVISEARRLRHKELNDEQEVTFSHQMLQLVLITYTKKIAYGYDDYRGECRFSLREYPCTRIIPYAL